VADLKHWKMGVSGRIFWRMATIVRCNCGAEYERTEAKFLMPHTGHVSCEVCGAVLECLKSKTVLKNVGGPAGDPELTLALFAAATNAQRRLSGI
jgi:hypothetical protein